MILNQLKALRIYRTFGKLENSQANSTKSFQPSCAEYFRMEGTSKVLDWAKDFFELFKFENFSNLRKELELNKI